MSQAVGPSSDGAKRALPARELLLTGGVAALYVSLGAIDGRIGRADPEAPDALMAWVSGLRSPIPAPTPDSQPWVELFNLDDGAAPLVWAFTAVDSAMALLYGSLLAGLLVSLRAAQSSSPPKAPLLTSARPWVAWVAAGSDLAENALLLAIFLSGREGERMSAGLASAAAVASLAKWTALAAAVVPLASGAVAWGWRRVRRHRE